MARFTPHPYLYAGPALMPDGYRPLTYRIEGGLNIESLHWIVQGGAAYDSGRADRSAEPPNPKGHDRCLVGTIYVRPGGRLFPERAFLGFGWRWSEWSTSKFVKAADRPQFGGGYDWVHRRCPGCRRDFSMRIRVDWFFTGSDWRDGDHGAELSLTLPSPREQRHWFWQERLGIFRFHSTVTDRENLALAQWERADRSLASFAQFGILYRF